MTGTLFRSCRKTACALSTLAIALLLAGCGGGNSGGATGNTGTVADSGPAKTTLSVQASDVDGDGLTYQWRVTGGTIDNRNASQTTWTLPDGPGVHFAYVMISDGKGGYTQQQYAVSTDALNIGAPARVAVANVAPPVAEFAGSQNRLRFTASGLTFASSGGAPAGERLVYQPDVQVQVLDGTTVVYNGTSDASGDVVLPKLANGRTYAVRCTPTPNAPMTSCGTVFVTLQATVLTFPRAADPSRNLRLYGHVMLADGSLCGTVDEFFLMQSSATVRLTDAGGQFLTSASRVNRYGDYLLDAAVPVTGALKLQVQCEGLVRTLDVPAPPAAGYQSGRAIELSVQLQNTPPRVTKMVAVGVDGNLRGRMIGPGSGAGIGVEPGANQYLIYKGLDTRLSACMYYRSFGAAKDCDPQGNMVQPIAFNDWKRQHRLSPYNGSNGEVSANYINRMDLNLVRHMVATQAAPNDIAFYVCNGAGPDGSSQAEIDRLISDGVSSANLIACVAMEWSVTPGVNGDLPYTKFLTFGPDGSLLLSINLDGRGEKFLPGSCVACHGGMRYGGHFPEQGTPSSSLGSNFLAFDTGNYLFSSGANLSEQAQTDSFHALNQLVAATEALNDYSATKALINGWYANGSRTLDKSYVPQSWKERDASDRPGAARFYREVVGISCRTCHEALGSSFRFDWDRNQSVLLDANPLARQHVCGATSDIALNASMPNALVTSDRVLSRVQADPSLAALMTTFIGCSTPASDPAYAKR